VIQVFEHRGESQLAMGRLKTTLEGGLGQALPLCAAHVLAEEIRIAAVVGAEEDLERAGAAHEAYEVLRGATPGRRPNAGSI
jgi:hypothetical protein